jgi:hypothetical protein
VLVNDQSVAGGLADQLDRDLDGDLLAPADDQEVDVLERVLDRVTLDGLGQREAGVPSLTSMLNTCVMPPWRMAAANSRAGSAM